MITRIYDLYFRFKISILLVQTKTPISLSYGSNTSSWKPWRWVKPDLIFTIKDIYINFNLNPLTKFTISSRSTEFKDILSWTISQMITKTIPVSSRIVKSYVMKRGISYEAWRKVNGNWDNMIRISQWRKSHCKTNTSITVEQILASEQKNNPREQDLESHSQGFKQESEPFE